MKTTCPRARRASLPVRLAAAVCAVLLAVTTVLTCVPSQARAESLIEEIDVEQRDELYAHARLGVAAGTLTEYELADAYPEADLQLFPSDSDVVAAVAGNKIDYGFVTEFYAIRFMENNDGYMYVTPVFTSFEEAFAVNKNNTELRDKISAVLDRYKEDGTLQAIKDKWLVDRNYTMDDVPTCDTGDEVLRVACSSADEPYLFVQDGELVGLVAEVVRRVACSSADEPYLFVQDGELVGLVAEVVRRVASELGMRVELQDMNFAGEIAAVATGKADIATQLTPTEERLQQVDFTSYYSTAEFGALAKSDIATDIDFIQAFKDNFNSTFITENRWQLVLNGLQVTCIITVGSFALGTVLALALSWMSRRGNPVTRAFVALYNKLATGVPVLVWLMILYYVVFASVDISAIVVAILCFGLQSASPISGVIETGLAAVDKGQVEASLAMGFSPFDTFRHVVAPQALARVWSLYSGEFSALIKETSIVGYIALQDLTKASDIIRSRTFQAFFPLIATAVVYFVAIVLCDWIFKRLGRLLDPKRRRPANVLKGVKTRD